MKGQGVGLWVVAIGLIGLFMLATMIAPALMNKGTEDNGTDTTGGSGDIPQVLSFEPPTITLGTSSLDFEESTSLTMRTKPDSNTTGDGGSFAWVISVQGTGVKASAVRAEYDGDLVQWYSGGSNRIVGMGPRFTQGPGAEAVEVSATFNFTPAVAGRLVIEAWIVVIDQLVSLDPTGLEAASPSRTANLQVAEKVEKSAIVEQSLEGPDSAVINRAVSFTLGSEGRATGKWNGKVADQITVSKTGIRSSDVVLTVSGGKAITWVDEGDRLVGTLQTTTPFEGKENAEDADWSVSFTVTFRTVGTYTIECSAWNPDTEEALTEKTIAHAVAVTKAVVTAPPKDNTSGTNDTVDGTVAPVTPVTPTPVPTTTPTPTPAPTPTPTEEPATPTPVVDSGNVTAGL